MAATLSLVRKNDFAAGWTVSLLSTTDGVDLDYYAGYTPAAAVGNDPPPVTETINLIVSGDDNDDLATNLQGLDQKIKETFWYSDEYMERYPVWLRCQLSAETGGRQALLYSIAGESGESVFSPYTDGQSVMRRYTLALTRGALWERTSATNYAGSLSNLFGSTVDYTTAPYTAVPGDDPARIARVAIGGVASGGGPLTEFWFGFRTNRFGDRANFQPIWDCGDVDATMGTKTTRTNTGGDVYDGWEAVVAYQGDVNDEMNTRVTMTTDDVTANYTDQRGAYIVLLRACVTAGSWRVRLQDGPEGSDADVWRTQDRVLIASTSYYVYELGTVRLPAQREVDSMGFLQKYAMRLQAELVSGAGDLHLDALSLIPYAEGAMHLLIHGTGVQEAAGDTDPARVFTHPDGTIESWWYDGSIPEAPITPNPLNWGLPVGNGIVVMTAQRTASHVLTDDATIFMDAFPRWRTLRGAE